MSDESLAHLKRFPRLDSILLTDTPIGDSGLAHFAGRRFFEVRMAGTRVTARGLLDAHFEAREVTIDDQQGDDTELAALEGIYESLTVVPSRDEVESE